MRNVFPAFAATLLLAALALLASGDVPPSCPDAAIESAVDLTLVYAVGHHDVRYRAPSEDPLCQVEQDPLVGNAVGIRWFRDDLTLQDVTVVLTAHGMDPITVPMRPRSYHDVDEGARLRTLCSTDLVTLPQGFSGVLTATIHHGPDPVSTVTARHL